MAGLLMSGPRFLQGQEKSLDWKKFSAMKNVFVRNERCVGDRFRGSLLRKG